MALTSSSMLSSLSTAKFLFGADGGGGGGIGMEEEVADPLALAALRASSTMLPTADLLGLVLAMLSSPAALVGEERSRRGL